MTRHNCWEHHDCGRERGGHNVDTLGQCPATTDDRLNGINGGVNGGRACWAIAGTLCGGKVQGSFASKLSSCLECEFYDTVMHEEAGDVWKTTDILMRLARLGGPIAT